MSKEKRIFKTEKSKDLTITPEKKAKIEKEYREDMNEMKTKLKDSDEYTLTEDSEYFTLHLSNGTVKYIPKRHVFVSSDKKNIRSNKLAKAIARFPYDSISEALEKYEANKSEKDRQEDKKEEKEK